MTGALGPKADRLRCNTFPQQSCDQQTLGTRRRVDPAVQPIDDSPHFPTPGAHDSHDSAIVQLQTEVAHAAGIIGSIASWRGQGSFEDCGMPPLLPATARHGLNAFACSEVVKAADGIGRVNAVIAVCNLIWDDEAWRALEVTIRRTCVLATWRSVGRRVAVPRKASTHIEWEECYPCIPWRYATEIGFNRLDQGLVGAGMLLHIRIAGAQDQHIFLPVLGHVACAPGNHL